MKVLTYGLVRAAMFGAFLGVLYAVGWWDVLAILAAVVTTALVSYLALPRLRTEAAQQLNGFLRRWERRDRADESAEDAEVALHREAKGQE